MSNYDYKQVLVLRTDLKMTRGKEIAQGAHASMAAYLDYKNHPYVKGWLAGRFAKIAVGVNSYEELEDIWNQAYLADVPRSRIVDSGFTMFKGVPTVTAVAVGPGPIDVIDKITGGLKLR